MERYVRFFEDQDGITENPNFKFIKNKKFNKSTKNLVHHITSKKYTKNILNAGLISGHSRGFYKKSLSPDSVWFWLNELDELLQKMQDQNDTKEIVVLISLENLEPHFSSTAGFVRDSIPIENIYGILYLKNNSNLNESQDDIKKGDIIKFGKYKNKTATVTGFGTDKNNQPTVITDKGEMSLYHVRIDKLMKEGKLEEDLHLSDFVKHAGESLFTKQFRLDRQRLKGTGNKSSKIKELRVNRKKGYITFVFESTPTYTKVAKAVYLPSMEVGKEVRQYREMVRIMDFFALAETKPGYDEKEMTFQEVKEILQVASIKIFCDCPSFHWQGDNYVASMFDASVFPTTISPKHWKKFHNDDNFACKHLDILFSSGMNIYINNMTSMINRYLKKGK